MSSTTRTAAAEATDTSMQLATRIAQIMDELKSEDIVTLDLRGVADVADCFVIATVNSAPQMKAVAWRIYEKLKAEGVTPVGPIEDESPRWNIIDYSDVVVHLFEADARKLYQLEQVWGDAEELQWNSRAGAWSSAPQ